MVEQAVDPGSERNKQAIQAGQNLALVTFQNTKHYNNSIIPNIPIASYTKQN